MDFFVMVNDQFRFIDEHDRVETTRDWSDTENIDRLQLNMHREVNVLVLP
jgi:hypothetical protein